jgi:Domain of unknown function (DUF4411)
MAYLLDANVFIQAKNLHYGLDFCPAFWDWLERANAAGIVLSIEKVGDELKGGADELTTWASSHPAFFISPVPEVIASLRMVSAWASAEASTGRYSQAALSTFHSSPLCPWSALAKDPALAGGAPVGSGDLELLVAEVGDELERAAEGGDEPVQHVLGGHVTAFDLGHPGNRHAHPGGYLLLGHPAPLAQLGQPPSPGIVQHRRDRGIESLLAAGGRDRPLQVPGIPPP